MTIIFIIIYVTIVYITYKLLYKFDYIIQMTVNNYCTVIYGAKICFKNAFK